MSARFAWGARLSCPAKLGGLIVPPLHAGGGAQKRAGRGKWPLARSEPAPRSPRANARGRINETVLATRLVPEACAPPRACKNCRRPKGRRSAERRMPTMCRAAQTSVGSLRHPSAARLRAIVGGAPAFRRFDRGSRRDSHPGSAPGHASWIENQAGVIRSIASQCSGSTPRLGRNTEGNDARSRSGAGCEPARKHRTRSTLRIASGMRPS